VSTELRLTHKKLREARCPEDVFGLGDHSTLREVYRRLTKIVHPDQNPLDPENAKDAMHLLATRWSQTLERLKNGTYGQWILDTIFSLQTRIGLYEAKVKIADGEISTLYEGTIRRESKDPKVSYQEVILKVVGEPKHNDFMDRETQVIKAIREDRHVKPLLLSTVPDPIEQFRAQYRRVNAYVAPHGVYSAKEILAEYPHGIDPRDMVWMWKRALSTVGLVHANGYLHGALLPQHVMFDIENHGVYLVGWTSAVRLAEHDRIRLIDPTQEHFYPPEVIQKKRPLASTDLFMLANVMLQLLGGDVASNKMPSGVPPKMAEFLQGCLTVQTKSRLDNAWALHSQINDHLESWFGPRKFRVFSMPRRVGYGWRR
jgi:hypothetical protein